MVYIHAFILPNSAKNQIIGLHGSELKIKINAVPEDGKANLELIKFLSKLTGVSKTKWSIHRGHSNRKKVLCLSAEDFSCIKPTFWDEL